MSQALRSRVCALWILVTALSGCGVYGPPVRSSDNATTSGATPAPAIAEDVAADESEESSP